VSTEDVVETLRQLAEVLQSQRTLGAALASIAEAATVSVPGCDAASIAISVEGRPASAVVTARVALEMDMVQYDLHDGPCLTAFRAVETVRLNVVEPGDDFPHFAVAAQKRGIRSVLSVPATWGDEVVATMNLYSRTTTFDETAESTAVVLAAQVAIAVSRSPEFAAARNVVEQAQRDSDDKGDINIAAGLLMITQACTADQAQGLLQQAAIDDEETLLEIAHRIIDQHTFGR
jgi:GAF domain-containing protein